MVLVFNGNQIAVYFKHAGAPYPSDFNQNNMKYLGIVATIWNFAFFIQFLTSYLGTSILQLTNENPGKEF